MRTDMKDLWMNSSVSRFKNEEAVTMKGSKPPKWRSSLVKFWIWLTEY